ncbi:MAG: AI-2E family transporter [Treponema sp.]|jgi:predicted PurR-regulated permease PerM|nr:AI-2E family transporter [Treponema sp.]
MSGNGTGHSRWIQNTVFGAILILLFLVVCRLFAPFFTVLLWSVLFYILLGPIHAKLVAPLNRTAFKGAVLYNLWAIFFSLGVVILILLPLFFVGFQLYRQVMELIRQLRDYLAVHSFQDSEILEDISQIIADLTSDQIVLSAGELRNRILSYLTLGLQNLLRVSSHLVRNVGSFLAGLVFMLFILFFFFMDGPYLARLGLGVIPIRREYLKALVGKFKEIIRNLALGYIMVALFQTLLAFIIFTIFKVKGALVFAALTFICVFVPILGGGLVWLPLGIVRLLSGDTAGGILFLAVSGFFISTLDNVIRPMFLRNQIQLHPLIIFFAILGGVSVFGFNGVILGPMVVILFLTVLDLFLREHKLEGT